MLPAITLKRLITVTQKARKPVQRCMARVLPAIAIVGLTAGIADLLWQTFRQQGQLATFELKIQQVTNVEQQLALEKDRLLLENAITATRAQVIGGVLLCFAAGAAWRSLQVAQEKQGTARFGQAVEQLSHSDDYVRLGAIYSLERIAHDSNRDYWPVMEILAAYVRGRSPWTPEKAAAWDAAHQSPDLPEIPPLTLDIQAVLTVLNRRQFTFDHGEQHSLDLRATDLRRANLGGAKLRGVLLLAAHLDEANLENADLEGADLENAHLKGADLTAAKLVGANLDGAHLEKASLREANLGRANLASAHLEHANLEHAHLEHANLRKAHLVGANLGTANLAGSYLAGANLERAHLEHANLEKANLAGANLEKANLEKANLGRANLRQAQLTAALLQGADLAGANLKRAHLEDANLENANLTKANLEGAHLGRSNLRSAHLSGANLEKADLEAADLEGAHLKKANLEGAFLEGAKTLTLEQLAGTKTNEYTQYPDYLPHQISPP
jgi:uncharacterized protein YjbI with pentapeptide repeats